MGQYGNVTDTARPDLSDYDLADRYRRDSGRLFASGVQALARLPIDQLRIDRANGLSTAAFISGYQGSPVASVAKCIHSGSG
jgi:indolepyruvate ferredoxin oxidoreductase